MSNVPSLQSFFVNLPLAKENWIISYFFKQDIPLNKDISLQNNISRLEEIITFPKGYHRALQDYTASFNEDYAKFLKENYGIIKPVNDSFTHPVDKVRMTNDGIDYVSFVGAVGIKYLPVDESLRGNGKLYIDKDHPISLIAPDNTFYTYFGISGMKGTCSRDNSFL